MKLWPKNGINRLIPEILKGSSMGGIVGTALAISTGAAAIITAPAWLPIAGGVSLISGATVAAWAAGGAAIGAATSGVVSASKAIKEDRENEVNEKFNKEFIKK